MSRRRTRTGIRTVGLLLVSALATAACGSTVQTTNGTATLDGGGTAAGLAAPELGGDALGTAPDAGTGSGNGSSPLAGSDSASGGAGNGSGGTSGSGSVTGPAGSTSTSGSQATAPGGTAPTGGTFTSGPGVTATTIAVGIPYCSDCAAADAALGAQAEDGGDLRRYYNAALEEVNGRGGVLGRKLVAVFHEVSASDNIEASQQAACETFTKDNKVAVMFLRGEVSYECAKKAGIIVIGQGGTAPVFARYPNLFAPGDIRLERLGAVTVKGMVAADWHKPTPKWPTGKIGLITWENNEYKFAMEKGWLPALRESGLKETDVRYIAVPQSDRSLAESSSAISSAVLSFRERGIDHVFIADGPAGIFRGGGLTFQFLNGAQSQKYFPRYGFNSNNAPGSTNYPAEQQVGMVAINSNDLQRSNDEGIALNPQRERCYALMQKNALKATDGKPTGIKAIEACGIAWFTEAIFERATSGTTLEQVIAAAESLGTSYRSPGTYGNRIGPGRHDGVSFFRNARFDEGCSCMKYTSKPYEP